MQTIQAYFYFILTVSCRFFTSILLDRNMLSAAHVLAMDAKNLLDVVNCIRDRYPHIDWRTAIEDDTAQPITTPAPSTANQHAVPNNQPTNQNQVSNNQPMAAKSPVLSSQSSIQEEEPLPPKPDFKINQPVTTGQVTVTDIPKEHTSLPTNRVSTLIHNYNVSYSNNKDSHIYGNIESVSSLQHSSSSINDEPKIDDAPMQSVKSRVQALTKINSEPPPIYSVSKKVAPMEQNIGHSDQG